MTFFKYGVKKTLGVAVTLGFVLYISIVALDLGYLLGILSVTPTTDEPQGRKNIFFVETRSPRNMISYLTPRQSCSIESAAIQNPDWNIFIFVLNVKTFKSKPYWEIIRSLPNVYIKVINAVEFARGTPTEELLKKGLKTHPEWLISHTSDVLRYTTLYKYAGVYMDLDIISLKSLNELAGNFAGQQDSDPEIYAGSAVVGFSDDEVGRTMARRVAQDVAENFTGAEWGANGLGTLSRGISKQCGTHLVVEATEKACKGFLLYPIKKFYAIPYFISFMFFNPNHYDEGMELIEDSVVTHLWSYMSVNETSRKGSKSIICDVAEKQCPRTFQAGHEFCL